MKHYKYPRTAHLPTSKGISPDDIGGSATSLLGKEVVVTLKMDGECSTVYPDGYTHARSVTTSPHPSRSWLKSIAPLISSQLLEGERICGENMYAVHSIKYDELPSYFLAFSLWQEEVCLAWDSLKEVVDRVNAVNGRKVIDTVPVIYRGILRSVSDIENLYNAKHSKDNEGFVIRFAGAFGLSRFQSNILKWVRANHVQTDDHWLSKPVTKNGLI